MLKRLTGNREPSDFINPVLLKELRQSVRSRQFVGVFVAVQIAMILFVIFVLATASGSNDVEEVSVAFWFIVGVYLLFILPLSGLNSLGREYDDARLDLLQLSSMNSRGIVLGKWLSLNFQGLLVVLSLLPYIVLRYFTGSVNPLYELIILGVMLYCSLVLSGAAICVSVVRGKVLRVIVVIGLFFGSMMFIEVLDNAHIDIDDIINSIDAQNFYYVIPIMLMLSALVGGLFLEFASARISPMAENHETLKRLYLLGVIALWWLTYLFSHTEAINTIFTVLCLAMTAVSISAIVGEPIKLPGVYCPFVRKGFLGKFLGRTLLYPGWISGANFTLLTFCMLAVILNWLSSGHSDLGKAYLVLISLFGSLLMPRAIFICLRMRDGGMRLFMLIQLVLICIVVLAMLTEEVKKWELTALLFWLPQAGVLSIGLIDEHSSKFTLYLIGNAAFASICYAIVLFGGWRQRRLIQQLEQSAIEINERADASKSETAATQSATVEA
ncbi:hypothetical protein [Cerasicoccus frondis]|uniref:hypothetical protein n=1 Tax=Cerasicoccus frondis TaxID=490090 RepID=UPI002852A4ED|nr:hypothetical protein [Cerasicoccus frondis]